MNVSLSRKWAEKVEWKVGKSDMYGYMRYIVHIYVYDIPGSHMMVIWDNNNLSGWSIWYKMKTEL